MDAIMGVVQEETGDFVVNEKDKVVHLTQRGVEKVEKFFNIENLADATALNFITVFIKFLADVRIHYSDVLKLRKQARAEINRLEGGTEGETS